MSIAEELLQPDQVQSLIEAMRRLVAGAGKSPYDLISIDEECGWTFNGIVYTRVDYPFGFKTNLLSDGLKKVLGHLQAPKISLGDMFITIKEGGKTFRLGRTPTLALQPNEEMPQEWIEFSGVWLKCLLPLLPRVSGYRSFAGVYAEERGYVGCADHALGYVEAPGPKTPVIISKEMLDMLPSTQLWLGNSTGSLVWIKSDNSFWAAPALEGEYPPWDSVIPDTDRDIVIDRLHLIDSLRAVSITSNTCIFDLLHGDQSKLTASKTSYGEARDQSISDAEVIIETLGGEGERTRQTNDAVLIQSFVDRLDSKTLKIGSDETQNMLLLKTIDATPTVTAVFMAVRGVDEIDYSNAEI